MHESQIGGTIESLGGIRARIWSCVGGLGDIRLRVREWTRVWL